MTQQGPEQDQDDRPRGTRTTCHSCGGDGVLLQPTTAVFSDGAAGSITVPKKCRPCDGRGWLPGLVIPV